MCVQLTESALFRLRTLLRSTNLGPMTGIRIGVEAGGCAGQNYTMKAVARPEAEDTSFDNGGVALYIDQSSLASLRGVELDWVEGVLDSGFRFSNPQATGSCGCGKSFSTSETCAPKESCHGH